jgi:hypothetical protein
MKKRTKTRRRKKGRSAWDSEQEVTITEFSPIKAKRPWGEQWPPEETHLMAFRQSFEPSGQDLPSIVGIVSPESEDTDTQGMSGSFLYQIKESDKFSSMNSRAPPTPNTLLKNRTVRTKEWERRSQAAGDHTAEASSDSEENSVKFAESKLLGGSKSLQNMKLTKFQQKFTEKAKMRSTSFAGGHLVRARQKEAHTIELQQKNKTDLKGTLRRRLLNSNLANILLLMDTNNDGEIDQEELQVGLRQLGMDLIIPDFDCLFADSSTSIPIKSLATIVNEDFFKKISARRASASGTAETDNKVAYQKELRKGIQQASEKKSMQLHHALVISRVKRKFSLNAKNARRKRCAISPCSSLLFLLTKCAIFKRLYVCIFDYVHIRLSYTININIL